MAPADVNATILGFSSPTATMGADAWTDTIKLRVVVKSTIGMDGSPMETAEFNARLDQKSTISCYQVVRAGRNAVARRLRDSSNSEVHMIASYANAMLLMD